jgi:hypothetical protein
MARFESWHIEMGGRTLPKWRFNKMICTHAVKLVRNHNIEDFKSGATLWYCFMKHNDLFIHNKTKLA